jgi:aspartyl-tRNA(Asn)/glutamyl-tRNA(Gln) amidotransferase subunit C
MPAGEKITLEQVRHVAKLSRLALTEQQLARLAPQLESILEYVAKIDEVDVSGVEPMAHATPLHNVLRDDVPGPALPLEQVLQNAPDTDGPFFKVPKIIGGDEDSAG